MGPDPKEECARLSRVQPFGLLKTRSELVIGYSRKMSMVTYAAHHFNTVFSEFMG